MEFHLHKSTTYNNNKKIKTTKVLCYAAFKAF